MRVDIGVFAHDEGPGIAAMVARLLAQDLTGLDARLLVLANGCHDDTAARARAAGAEVAELAEGGKSRTWNRFVHDLSRPDAGVLVFVDADIDFDAPDSLRRLALGLAARPALWVLNSQPVKDIVARPEGLSAMDRLIAAAGGGLDDWKTAICGQLYAMPAARSRSLHLPIGLPVEDGFLRAMVLTDALTGPEDFSRIDGLDGLSHTYASERTLPALIRHQTRIVIGSALNFAAFDTLRALAPEARRPALAAAAADEGWLARAARARLPRWPFGFVPFHFLTKRLSRALAHPRQNLRPRRAVVTLLGFGFDAIVYLLAQYRMARGAGAGFW
ncbi:glycosyl transferase group 2 family protein [Tabrizicola oligotrophica]|uniref:Glycosyl transferase group 2 family protein n=1 Tax=Tabrizicola oligotrophica TaxID=2710650 RepID=A0A6M0QVP6_9RHOB|nr:glycosyl transferase group 2 family protein [Tabrizicola oligotrophica]NEY90542.1 glycosyl transferase group 2 family protein [Tabrizicola oligotrophica]